MPPRLLPSLEFSGEFFNIFNRVVLGSPSASINAPNLFGRISWQPTNPRQIQFALKLIFQV